MCLANSRQNETDCWCVINDSVYFSPLSTRYPPYNHKRGTDQHITHPFIRFSYPTTCCSALQREVWRLYTSYKRATGNWTTENTCLVLPVFQTGLQTVTGKLMTSSLNTFTEELVDRKTLPNPVTNLTSTVLLSNRCNTKIHTVRKPGYISCRWCRVPFFYDQKYQYSSMVQNS